MHSLYVDNHIAVGLFTFASRDSDIRSPEFDPDRFRFRLRIWRLRRERSVCACRRTGENGYKSGNQDLQIASPFVTTLQPELCASLIS